MTAIIESSEQYHASGAIGKGHLDLIARSPRHYWAAHIDPARVKSEPTDAMVLGSAVHSAVLEPATFAERYLTLPADAPRRPSSLQRNAKKPSAETVAAIKWWDDFNASADGRTMLTAEQWAKCEAIAAAVNRHPIAGGLFHGGIAESSFYATDAACGATIKCRPDYLRPGMMLDLKTSGDASPDGFARSCATWRYPVQHAHYQMVYELSEQTEPPPFVFVVVETEHPYCIGVYSLAQEDVLRGQRAARRDLWEIVRRRQQNDWPDYANEPRAVELQMPAWWRLYEDKRNEV